MQTYVSRMRSLASGCAPAGSVKAYLSEIVANVVNGRTRLPDFTGDDLLHYEDDQVSIWQVRFHPDVLVPPHDHQMNVYIGVYDGAEQNYFYRRDADGLQLVKSKVVDAGEVISIGPQGIHAVQAHGGRPSLALHVYLGPLTKVDRSLFDWETGEPTPFTDAAYARLVRNAA